MALKHMIAAARTRKARWRSAWRSYRTTRRRNWLSQAKVRSTIRRWEATDAAAYEGARLREGLLDNPSSRRRALDTCKYVYYTY